MPVRKLSIILCAAFAACVSHRTRDLPTPAIHAEDVTVYEAVLKTVFAGRIPDTLVVTEKSVGYVRPKLVPRPRFSTRWIRFPRSFSLRLPPSACTPLLQPRSPSRDPPSA